MPRMDAAHPAFCAAIICSLLLPQAFATPAFAQPPTPGVVKESLETRGKQPVKEQPSLPEAAAAPSPEKPKPPAEERSVRINSFTINGNTLFSEDELRAVIADREGAELTLSEIYGLADRLTEFYQAKGYSLTTVTVPAQRIQAGVLRLEVVEGKVGNLNFKDNERYSDAFLSRQLDLVKSGTILRFADLEREVLLLNDLPGLIARSVLTPGTAYGTTDINLLMEEKILSASAVLDNTGPKVVGKWRLGADFSINNPFRLGDILSFGYTHTQANLLRQGRVSYGLPVFASGGRLSMSYSRAEYDVGEEYAILDIQGVSETARLQMSHPLLRSRRDNLSATAGYSYVRGRSDIMSIPLSDDTIRFFDIGLTFSHRLAAGGLASLSGQLATNFRSNDDGAHSDALPPRLELKGDYEHPFDQDWSLACHSEAVWSNDPLPDSNKFGIGGPASVRGFVSSKLRGDQGGMGSLELRYRFSFEGMAMQLRSFVDTGAVFYEIPLADGTESEGLASAGLGLTATVAGNFILDVAWAKPIDGKDPGDGLDAPLWLICTATY